MKLSHDLLHDGRDFCRVCRIRTCVTDRTAADRLICEAVVRQHALQLAAERADVSLLFVRQRLSAVSHLESAQFNRRAKSFRELGGVDHRVKQFHKVILNRTCRIDLI